MDTPAQFRRSERHTLPARLAVFAAALALGLIHGGASPLLVAGIGAAFAGYTALLRLALAPRFRSDAWTYGMLGGDTLFAGAAAYALGPAGPALAIPAFFTAQYALFLGYRGGATAAGAGVAAMAAGALVAGTSVAQAVTISLPVLGGLAAIAGYIAEQRFAERADAQRARHAALADADAARLLDGLAPIAAASGESAALEALADVLPSLADLPAAAVYSPVKGAALTLRAARLEAGVGRGPAGHDDPGGSTPMSLALRRGVAVPVGEGGLPASSLPGWAVKLGYDSGFAAPVTAGAGRKPVAVVLGLGRTGRAASVTRLRRLERFLALAGRLISAMGSAPAAAADRSRLAYELESAGRGEAGAARRPITRGGLSLDPETDHSSVGGTSIALSRTEFDLLYALADRADNVIETASLVASAWGEGEAGEDRAVDSAIYRLRRKLAKAPGGEGIIRTVRGKGYTLVPPEGREPEGVAAAAD